MSEIRNRFSPRGDYGISFDEPSLTKQSMANEVDVNKIIARHKKTGVVTHLNRKAPRYGDFSHSQSLHDALNLVHDAEEEFMTLPAAVRKACNNNPVEFLAMLADEDGTKVLTDAGLDANISREDEAESTAEQGESENVSTESGTDEGDASSDASE